MEEIRFLRDDLEEQRKENIKALMSFLEEKPVSNEVFATKRFMVSAIYAAKTIKDRRIMEEKKKQESFRPKIILKTEKPNAMPVVEEELPVLELPEIEIPDVSAEIYEEKPAEIKTKLEYGVILSSNQTLAKAAVNLEPGKLKYDLIEPSIEFKVLARTVDLLGKKLKKDPNILKDDKLLAKYIKKSCKKYKIEFTDNYFENVKYYLYRDYLHFGKIDPLLVDKKISKIMCDGLNKPIIIVYDNQKMETNIIFMSNDEINNVLYKFAKFAGRNLDANNTALDGVVNDFRIEATLGLEEIGSRFALTRIQP